MKTKTLENLSLQQLTQLFNAAFADYFVKIELTPKMLNEKIISEDIKPEKSAGVFVDEKPLGFIFHSIRKKENKLLAYNAGTGVVPEFRGQNATVKMYNYILPILKNIGVSKVELEVMEQNTPAIKSYEKAGFKKTGNLVCFKGIAKETEKNKTLKIVETDFKMLPDFENFCDWEPSWQHANETVVKTNSYKIISAEINKSFAGYMVFNPTTGRVAQFAVKPSERKKGVASALFAFASQKYHNELTCINIDENAHETVSFLKARGMKHFITQYKMEIQL